MPYHTRQFYMTVLHAPSGELMRRLGPFSTACGTAAGQPLTWDRGSGVWLAEKYPVVFQVPADEPGGR